MSNSRSIRRKILRHFNLKRSTIRTGISSRHFRKPHVNHCTVWASRQFLISEHHRKQRDESNTKMFLDKDEYSR